MADLHEFKRSGVNPWSMSHNPLRTFKSTTTREAVASAYLEARDEVAAFNGEDSGSAYLARNAQQLPVQERLAKTAPPHAAQ